MKAEERHRLQENDLVKGLKSLSTGTKRPPNTLLLMVGLLVVVVVVYWYWSSTAASRISRAWVQYYQNKDNPVDAPKTLESGPAGQALKLAQADAAYDRGFNQLFTNPQQALKEFTDAAQQFADLSKQASNSDIQLRALVGAGKAYESGGKVKEAIEFYEAALNKFGGKEWQAHPLLKEARENKDKLAAGGTGLAGLYASWEEKLKQVTTDEPKPPTLPNIPNIPLPPDAEKK